MADTHVFSSRNLLLTLTVLLAALLLLLQRRGPELPGYRIEARPLLQIVVATGRVIGTSRAQVGSEVIGTVRERLVQEGDRVRAGDVLAVLNAADLAARVREIEAALLQLRRTAWPEAEATLRQADLQLLQAGRERQRREDLFQRQLLAREALEQAQHAEALARAAADRARAAAAAAAPDGTDELLLRERLADARAQLAKTTLRAQVDGVVLTRNVEPGDLVQPGRVLFEIARDGPTEIEVPVDEKNLAVLRLGQHAVCLADAWPDSPIAATVNYIAPSVDAARGTVTVRLRVAPVPEFLRQDMTVSVNIETGRRDVALAVPNDALLDAGGTAATVLAVRDGRVARVAVTIGLKGLAMTEVTAGLVAGDRVLADAAASADLAEGARVRLALEALPAGGTPAAWRREVPMQFD